MKFCDSVPFGFAVRSHQFDSGWKQYLSGISWSRDTTMRIVFWSYRRFCVLLVRGVYIKFQPIAFYCIIIQLCESIFSIRVRRGLNSTSAENSHVTDLRFVSILIDTNLIDGPPGRPGSGRVKFIALTTVLWREFHHTFFRAKDA